MSGYQDLMFSEFEAKLLSHFQISISDGQYSYPFWVWVPSSSYHHQVTHEAFRIANEAFSITEHQIPVNVQNCVQVNLQSRIPRVACNSVGPLPPFANVQHFMAANNIAKYDPKQDFIGIDQIFLEQHDSKVIASMQKQTSLSQLLISHQHHSLAIAVTALASYSQCHNSLGCRQVPSILLRTISEIQRWFVESVSCTNVELVRQVLNAKVNLLNNLGDQLQQQEEQQFECLDFGLDQQGMNRFFTHSSQQQQIAKPCSLIDYIKHHQDNRPLPEVTDSEPIAMQPSKSQPSMVQPPELYPETLSLYVYNLKYETPATVWSSHLQRLIPTLEKLQSQQQYVQYVSESRTFRTNYFTLKQVKQGIKNATSSRVISQLITAFLANQFRAAIIGPSHVANMLGRSLSLLLPPSQRHKVMYASIQVPILDCRNVHTEETNRIAEKKSIMRIEKDQIDPKAPKQIGLPKEACQTCGRYQHLTPIFREAAIHCINGDYQCYDSTEFLNLEDSICVVDLLADREDNVVLNFNHQQGQKQTYEQIKHYQITGQLQQLQQMYYQQLQQSTLVPFESSADLLKRGFNYVHILQGQQCAMAVYLCEATAGNFVRELGLNSRQCLIQYEANWQRLSCKAQMALDSAMIVSLDMCSNSLGFHRFIEKAQERLGGLYLKSVGVLTNCPVSKNYYDPLNNYYKYVMEYFVSEILDALDVAAVWTSL